WSLSHTMANLAWLSLAKATICSFFTFSGSSTLMARTVRSPGNLSTSSWYLGKDFLQGSQKVPQKSRMTTLPSAALRVFGPSPPTGSAVISGAGLPISGWFLPEASAAPPPSPQEAARIDREAQANRDHRIGIMRPSGPGGMSGGARG